MNTYKRNKASGKKSAGNRGMCTVLHDYEKDYGSKLAYNGQAAPEPSTLNMSISPSRKYAGQNDHI